MGSYPPLDSQKLIYLFTTIVNPVMIGNPSVIPAIKETAEANQETALFVLFQITHHPFIHQEHKKASTKENRNKRKNICIGESGILMKRRYNIQFEKRSSSNTAYCSDQGAAYAINR